MKNKYLKVLLASKLVLFSVGFQATLASDVAAACVSAGANCLTAVDTTVPLDSRVPLILIHGWNPIGVPAPPLTDDWKNFRTYFKGDASLQKAYKLYEFSYNSNSVSITELGTALRDLLDLMSANDPTNFGSKPISIIGHSMGGLIARYFLTLQQFQGAFNGKPGGERVLQLITLGTPHHGTPLANGPAMLVKAGVTWGPALATFGTLFYTFAGPAYNQVNRSDLHWDNYDGILDYSFFSNEQNLALNALNGSTTYDTKIITYAGSVSPSPLCVLGGYECWGSTVLGGVFGFANDGVVPLVSAQFDGHGVINGPSRFFSGYNHSELVTGKGNNDTLLFGRIRNDLLTTFQSCHLINSGDPVPDGWGTPYDVFSQEHELFLKILCTTGNTGSTTTFEVVNRGMPTNQFQVTWAGNTNVSAGYKWMWNNPNNTSQGGNWLPLSLSGGTPFKDSQGNSDPLWRVGTMSTTIPSSLIQSGTNYVLAYVCTWTGTQWKCGCHDSVCAPNFWQLQVWE